MKKTITIIIVVIAVLAALTACNTSGTDPKETPSAPGATPGTVTPETTAAGPEAQPFAGTTLVIYTWEEMFPDEIISAFEAATGVNVTMATFDTDETMLAKLESTGGTGYDLVIADDYIIQTTITEGLAQKLDKSLIANYGNINPSYQGQFYDPYDEYTVPYGAGVQTIVYNPEAVSAPITCYADLWRADLRGKLGVIGNSRVITGMALKVLGISYNTSNLDDIRRAGDKLLELAPNVKLIKDDDLQTDLLNGQVDAAVMYTSMVTLALLENPDLEVVYPPEGIGFGVMGAFVPSKASNAAAAHAFLDFILDPQNGAECFEWLGYYCTFKASDALISDDKKDFLTLPAGIDMSTMEMIENVSDEAVELHDTIWSEFVAAAGA